MARNYKMLLDLNLDGMPRVEDKLLHVSRNRAFKSKITQSDFYESALSKYKIGTDLSEKITHIINLVNTKGFNIEVIQKSSKGRDFRNFIKAEQKDTSNAEIQNVAFIIRVGNIEESLVPANTVILTVTFEKTFKVVNGVKHPHFTEVLKSIQLTKLPEERYGHRAAVSLDGIEVVTTFETEETQLKIRDFGVLVGLEKAFDIYGSKKSKIQLKEQSHFIQKFFNFLKSKEDNKLTPYVISEEGTMKLEEEKEYSFYTIHRNIQTIEPKDKFYIGSNKDYSSKIGVIVKKSEETSYQDVIEEQIEEEENFIERSDQMIEENQSDISIEDARIDVLEEKINKSESKLEELKISHMNSQAVTKDSEYKVKRANEIHANYKGYENEVLDALSKAESDLKKSKLNASKIKKALSIAEKKLKETKDKKVKVNKLKKGEKIDHSLKEKAVKAKAKKINEIEESITSLKADIKHKDKLIAHFQELVEDFKTRHKEAAGVSDSKLSDVAQAKEVLKDSMKLQNKNHKEVSAEEEILKELINLISKSERKKDSLVTSIAELNQKIENSRRGIDDLNNNFDKFEEGNLVLTKLKVLVISSKREKSLQKYLNIETASFRDIAYRYTKDAYFSDYDAGLNMKYKRFFHTIRSYENGSYKSPYAALSLEKPDVAIGSSNEVKSQSINLNNLQQQALNATANSHFASFLQGPPGTGKTQVIASAVENEIANGGNVLISSSTNAAINNAMERMNRSKSNPNIFFLRHSNNIDKIKDAQDFTSQKLYPNFIERLDGFVSKNSLNEEIDLKPFENAVGERFTKKYVPSTYYNEYISQIKDIKDIEYFIKRFDIVEDEDVTLAKSEIEDQLSNNRRSSMKLKAEQMDIEVSKVANKVPFLKDDSFETYVDKLRNYSTNKGSIGEFNKRLKNLSKKFDPEKVKDTKSKEFASYLFKNSYINVIGITTTSELVIKETGGNLRRELFVDYPVNFAIIDEISKSVTPEILSVAKLADRFMFAGDYRQLPPTSEISPKLIEEFRMYCIENFNQGKMVDQTISTFRIDDADLFRDSIDSLLGISLFTNQVNDMKRSKKENTSYTALKTQYRFSSVINELVNLTYDTNESLEAGRKDSEFQKYEMGIKNLSNSSVTIVDTSFISQDYSDKLNKVKATSIPVEAGEEAFDHNKSFFSRRAPFNSKINEYNAHVIINVIINLKERNKKSFNPNNVGVIAMTRSQAQVIKRSIDALSDKTLSQIKVDTVDNFQGQEKDIIILDLVRARGQLSGKKIVYKNRNLDFYKKPERINVAVSRAQSKLIIIGAINEYLSQEVISEVNINGSLESIQLFEEWKDIVDTKGENTSWIDY